MNSVDGRREWRKSSHSGNTGCLEFTHSPDTAFLRDSKDATGPVLQFGRQQWTDFIAGLKAGEFDGTPRA